MSIENKQDSDFSSANIVRKLIVENEALKPGWDTRLLANWAQVFAGLTVCSLGLTEKNLTEGRHSGVLVYARDGKNPFISIATIGDVKPEKLDKYTTYALAKMAKLVQNPQATSSGVNELNPGDETLNISGNPVPGGAIRLPDRTILSFSGFSVEDDEALVKTVAALLQE